MKRLMYIAVAILALMGCSVDVKTEFIRSVSSYSDYSTVDWDDLGNKYYHPNTADWSAEVDSLIVNDFPMEIACRYWHLLQNARTDFHQKSLSLRTRASKDEIKVLNNTEALLYTIKKLLSYHIFTIFVIKKLLKSEL
jgi:hypothetical protein